MGKNRVVSLQYSKRPFRPRTETQNLQKGSKLKRQLNGRQKIYEHLFEPIAKPEVVAAQQNWAQHVTEQDVERLLGLYDLRTPGQPILFKPTFADVIRSDYAGVRSYFVGGDPNYPHDQGFLNRGWKQVEFRSAVGPVLNAGGLSFGDMGHYTFIDGDGNATDAEYTFVYHKRDGRVLISLHHSSLKWSPSEAD